MRYGYSKKYMKKTHKGSVMPWIIGGLVIVIGIIIFVVIQNNEQKKKEAVVKEVVSVVADKVSDKVSEKAIGVKEEARQRGETVVDQVVDDGEQKIDEIVENVEDNLPVGNAGTYEEYDAAKVAANDGALLFFHASWCPSCRALDKAITEDQDSIPGGLVILKLDYDEETELKKKYGVVGQHTLVQVDKDGNKITMWRGANSLDEVVAKLQ